jgi:IMP cyclohydrolase
MKMADDFSSLENMIYSGRGIVAGMTPSGNWFVGYSLTGRSPPSQARELVEGKETGTIRTNVTDKEQLEKGSPALLLYPAIVPVEDRIIASNGAQTKLIYSVIRNENFTPGVDLTRLPPLAILKEAFKEPFWEYDEKDDRWIDITTYEPDAPNNTPRISACVIDKIAAFDIVYRGENGEKSRITREVHLEPGKGKLITTYKGGNEKPLLPFVGEPLDVAMTSTTSDNIAESIYEAIRGGAEPGENYRVSAAVMLCKPSGNIYTTIINRSQRGA